uniref:MAP6 domain containing 1 n=1 Tax=Lates calcarifer TaxID=8187 RepID=A0A4W6E4Y5_LATCA
MAWPCISRVCCLARFWNQFDKSDLSVPLTIQNYSDIAAEQEVRSVTKQVSASERAPGNNYSTPDPVTQYKQDFKPWPIPRKENFPWISNGGSRNTGRKILQLNTPARGQRPPTSHVRPATRRPTAGTSTGPRGPIRGSTSSRLLPPTYNHLLSPSPSPLPCRLQLHPAPPASSRASRLREPSSVERPRER